MTKGNSTGMGKPRLSEKMKEKMEKMEKREMGLRTVQRGKKTFARKTLGPTAAASTTGKDGKARLPLPLPLLFSSPLISILHPTPEPSDLRIDHSNNEAANHHHPKTKSLPPIQTRHSRSTRNQTLSKILRTPHSKIAFSKTRT